MEISSDDVIRKLLGKYFIHLFFQFCMSTSSRRVLMEFAQKCPMVNQNVYWKNLRFNSSPIVVRFPIETKNNARYLFNITCDKLLEHWMFSLWKKKIITIQRICGREKKQNRHVKLRNNIMRVMQHDAWRLKYCKSHFWRKK